MKYWAFAIYSIVFESMIWGIFGYAVFIGCYSGWWILVAMIISCSQLKAKHFNITVSEDQ